MNFSATVKIIRILSIWINIWLFYIVYISMEFTGRRDIPVPSLTFDFGNLGLTPPRPSPSQWKFSAVHYIDWYIHIYIETDDSTNKAYLFEIWSILNNPVLIGSLYLAVFRMQTKRNSFIHVVNTAKLFRTSINPISKGFVHYFVYLNRCIKWLIFVLWTNVLFYLYKTYPPQCSFIYLFYAEDRNHQCLNAMNANHCFLIL